MKKILGILFYLAASCILSGQNISIIEKKLDRSFQRIQYWYDARNKDSFTYDSLYAANRKFEKLLQYYTSSNPQTLRHDFKSLKKNGLSINSSEDGKFRIYSWNTETGGTMRFYRSVFQYESGKKVQSEVLKSNMEDDAEAMYSQINDVISQNKKYYLAQSTAVYSSALFHHTIKVFSIENGKLNSNAKLIKTSSGIKNELGYELDFTATSNRENPISIELFNTLDIQYDAKKKIISIPLIRDDSRITDKKIRYHQFKGKYFEKL
ncbi:hypothetical protein WH221_11720 [Chryseobacterium culicis]|uniref:Uncharacterized protein n=1 Tax=Chryseobacterium culicis TaxID=680127 RepID=A0A2S9D2A1_CHRCI|nr:hypothetical protein [Chryseobacterium culicis]PRB86879.1 hypothetical protein CQ022_11705 [Chryseobacterium culicis]PRB92631.1 hypothetical protein CQ033_05375 [Chryseobacterium culicis]